MCDLTEFAMAFNCTNRNDCFDEKRTGTMNYLGTLSPAGSSMDSSDLKISSPMSSSISPTDLIYNSNLMLLDALQGPIQNTPYLELVEQPVEKFRFRYKSEMAGTHGSLTGMNTDKIRKNTYPTVHLHNYDGHAIIRCSLSQVNSEEPHAHRLVVKCVVGDKDDPHDISVSQERGYTAVFQGMGIIHTAKKHLTQELVKKKIRLLKEEMFRNGIKRSLTQIEEAEVTRQCEQESKAMNLNIVRLKFEAYRQHSSVLKRICPPIYSHGINNLKSALTGELKIVRMDHTTTSCVGGQEIFILVEKVTKNNIKVRFFECDEDDNEIWSDFGKFSHIDVHHQYAIVFKAPPYRDLNIENTVEVCIELFRPSDGARSEPRVFKYKPSEKIGRKRLRQQTDQSNSFSSGELPTVLNNSVSFGSSVSLSIPESLLVRDPDFFTKFENVNHEVFDELFKNVSGEYENLVTDGPSNSVSNLFANPVESDMELLTKKAVNQLSSIIKQSPKSEVEKFILNLFNVFCTEDGNNALHTSIICEQYEHLKYILILLSKMKHLRVINVQNNSRETALHLAVKINNPKVVGLLLTVGADPNLVDKKGNTPLHIAILSDRNLKDYRCLLDVTALDTENDDGYTPLHLAVLKNNMDSVKLLIGANANVNYKHRSNGNTILHTAIEEQCPDLVRYLLQNTKVRLDEENYAKTTPLHTAKLLADSEGQVSKEIFEIICNYLTDNGFESLVIKVEAEDVDSDSDSEVHSESVIKSEPLETMDIDKRDLSHLRKEFNESHIHMLSELLDGTTFLAKLIKDLDFTSICTSLQDITTRQLLNYANVTGIYPYQVRDLLKSYGADYVVKIMETKCNQ